MTFNVRVFARAALLPVFMLCIYPAFAADVYWVDVKLETASGVPESKERHYSFKGTLKVFGQRNEVGARYGGPKVPANATIANAIVKVEGTGTWDASKYYAEEKLVMGGGDQGTLLTRLRCDKDPWADQPTSCRVLGAVFSTRGDSSYDWPSVMYDWRFPLTQPAVTLARATELSMQTASRHPDQQASNLPAALRKPAPGSAKKP